MSLSCNGIDVYGVCRLCGSEDGIRINIFEPGAEHVRKIHKILPITVNEHDPFPKNMCHLCSFKVEEFFKFRTNCITAQETFKSKIPWLRKKKEMTTHLNHDIPPMVEVPLNSINSISPNEKQMHIKVPSVEENESPIEIEDDSPPYLASHSVVTNIETDHNHEKIIMKIRTSDIKKKSKRKSIWDVKKKKKKSNKTIRSNEVFSSSLKDLNVDSENDPLHLPSDENKNLKTRCSETNHRENNVLLEEKAVENINLPKYILVTNIPRVGNVYTCEHCGRTFLSPQPASLHVCETNCNKNSFQEEEKVSSSPNEFYNCEECDQVFTRHSQLIAHKRKHEVFEISSDDNFTPFNQRKRHHSKKKTKPKLLDNKNFQLSFDQIESTEIIKHSLLSSDSD
ncbi:uncharacterized protein LOC124362763 [Homalodisca vitripennis]|uniref:uncharacterized protein LOC124362763 n=1 Tax=Homalodisca vitripennis TaxID=197043 RepID=UPI001EEA5DB7|nr:uncharacterized protein LOC124362763 [Homalodisca vitripennis]